ncbi:sugar transferase [Pedobacter foliorum]|uniref:sugar transferase n=1 Tax=Pedobacter foliorum TaxID=2739058 RepID=UPI001564CD74|nr:sugar transferase [Pedobacter foliorum]NRF37249.1 sugar transferase [Pedobacter foliorum]
MNAKRVFDVLFAVAGLLFLLPVFLIVIVLLKLDSKGSIFYKQIRVGLNQKNFELIKFRTMYANSDKAGLLTIGDHDSRITRVGCWLRKYKIDELPQLINILKGEMSFVGPRPEVLKYVLLYDAFQKKVLTVKPGITDWASIQYIDENQLLANAEDPESFYINTIIPSKINQNLKYIEHHNLWVDLKIISYTLKSIISR